MSERLSFYGQNEEINKKEFESNSENDKEVFKDSDKKICYVGSLAEKASKMPIVGINTVKVFDKLSSEYQKKVFDNLMRKYFSGNSKKQNFYFEKFIEMLPSNLAFDPNQDSGILNHIFGYMEKEKNVFNYSNFDSLNELSKKINGNISYEMAKKIFDFRSVKKLIIENENFINKLDNKAKSVFIKKLFKEAVDKESDSDDFKKIITNIGKINFHNLDFDYLHQINKIVSEKYHKGSNSYIFSQVKDIYKKILENPNNFDEKDHQKAFEDLLIYSEDINTEKKRSILIDNIQKYKNVDYKKAVEPLFIQSYFLEDASFILKILDDNSLLNEVDYDDKKEILSKALVKRLLLGKETFISLDEYIGKFFVKEEYWHYHNNYSIKLSEIIEYGFKNETDKNNILKDPKNIELAKQRFIDFMDKGYVSASLQLIDSFLPSGEYNDFIIGVAKNGFVKNLREGKIREYTDIIDNFLSEENYDNEIINGITILITEGKIGSVLEMPELWIKRAEQKTHIESYKQDINLASSEIYKDYCKFIENNDEIGKKVFVEKINDLSGKMFSSQRSDSELLKNKYYKDLATNLFPNNANNWTNFENNDSCEDRSNDIVQFKIKEKYIIDTSDGVEMALKNGEEENKKNVSAVEKPIYNIQKEFAQQNFDKEKTKLVIENKIDNLLQDIDSKDQFTNQEEKIFKLLLESLTNNIKPDILKYILVGYQFNKFENVEEFFNGIRNNAEKSKNPRYAYLLELREFYVDKIKDVEHQIVDIALENLAFQRELPNYYRDYIKYKNSLIKQNEIARLRIDQIGLEGDLLGRIERLLNQKNIKGKDFKFFGKTETGELTLGQKGRAINGIINSEVNKAINAIKTLTGEELSPEDINLGDLNLNEYLQLNQKEQSGEYSQEIFAKYLKQIFTELFEKEVSLIDEELNRYKQGNADESIKNKRIEAYITKNKISAHARATGGVCVSGDNQFKAERENREKLENLWDMDNYFQMVFRDPERKDCKGLCLLHHFVENDKKVLTVSFNPSSTFLYTVNEKIFFDQVLKRLTEFAKDNDFDNICISQNHAIRTNRTGGEFERAIQSKINEVGKMFNFGKEKIFSYSPNYKIKNMDIVWENS